MKEYHRFKYLLQSFVSNFWYKNNMSDYSLNWVYLYYYKTEELYNLGNETVFEIYGIVVMKYFKLMFY